MLERREDGVATAPLERVRLQEDESFYVNNVSYQLLPILVDFNILSQLFKSKHDVWLLLET